MNDVPLLRADEIELGRVAGALRAGAMLVVVACAPRADAAARVGFAHVLGEDFRVEDVLLHDVAVVGSRLREHGAHPTGVVVRLVLDHGADVLDALNLHREKLRAPGARFALWVSGRNAYRELVRRAPDAFSFRDAVAIVEGDEPVPPPPNLDEPDALRAARARLERVGELDADSRATAWSELIEELFGFDGRSAAIEAAALVTWAEGLPRPQSDAVRRATARALCYRNANIDRRVIRQRVDVLEALSLLDGLSSPADRTLRVLLRTTVPGPPGFGRDWHMLELASREASSPLERARTARALFVTLLARDAVSAAEEPPHVSTSRAWGKAMAARDASYALAARGRWLEARRASHEVASLTMPKSAGLRTVARAREASLALRLGEIAASRRIAAELVMAPHVDVAVRASAARVDALALAASGRVAEAMDGLRGVIDLALAEELPAEALDALAALTSVVRDGYAAGLLGSGALEASYVEVGELADRCVASAGEDPPWFGVLATTLRANHLGRDAARQAEAMHLARGALRLAEAHAPILAPGAGRLVVRLLLAAGAHQEAALLAEALVPVAREHHVARDVAGLLADLTLIAARSGADVEAPIGRLRTAFEESAAVPLLVVMSREVGECLSRLGYVETARQLVEPALAVAQEVPWPEEQGRCLATLGRVEEASRHYQRWGLVLRDLALGRDSRATRVTAG